MTDIPAGPVPDQPYEQFPEPRDEIADQNIASDKALAEALRPWCYQFHVGTTDRAAKAAGRWLRARDL